MQSSMIQTDYDDEPLRMLTISDVVENRADELSDKTFAYYGHDETEISYQELNTVSNKIGNSLVSEKVQTGEYVGVMMENAMRTTEMMFGCSKAGCVYAPIDWHYKGQPLYYQINDTDPEILVIDDKFVGRLNAIVDDLEVSPKLIVRETTEKTPKPDTAFHTISYSKWLQSDSTKPDREQSWDMPAWLIYTSGTTGYPKGAILSHRWVLANQAGYVSQIHNEDDVFHCSGPLYHIGGAGYAVVSMLLSGGSVALWNRFSTSSFWDRIDKYNATSTILVGVMIDWLSKSPTKNDDHETTLYKVDLQPLPESLEEISRRFGFDIVTSSYGQTESGLSITGAIHPTAEETRTPSDLIKGKKPNEVVNTLQEAGVPVLETPPADRWLGQPRESLFEVEILNQKNEKVKTGETGEIALRPKIPRVLLNIYHGKPEKTLEVLSDLWYHTGDIGYRDEENHMYFVDRDHFIIRRRGENISSRHLEESINKHNSVKRSAVFPLPADEGDEDEIGASIEVGSSSEVTIDEIQSFLQDSLPEFMIPDHAYIIDELPTTETNKIIKSDVRDDMVEQLHKHD